MTSSLCVKQPGGSLHIHDPETVGQLTTPISPLALSEGSSRRRHRSKSSASSRYTTFSEGKTSQTTDSCNGRTGTIKDWLNAKSVKELQDRADKETRSTRKLLTNLLEGEKTFVKDADDYLNDKAVLDLRKRELLHKKWSDNVYEPLREKIHKVMDGGHWPEVDRRKREIHKQYLEFSNKKGHVFLDIIDPSEYYAMALHGHRPAPLQISTHKLRDPLLSQGSQRNEEDRTVLRCVTGHHYTDRDVQQIKLPLLPLVPLGRHGTEFKTWMAMPLKNIESTSRQASRRRMRGENGHQLDFEEWLSAPFDPAVVDREMKVQRRRTFTPIDYSDDCQRPIFKSPSMVDATTNTVNEE